MKYSYCGCHFSKVSGNNSMEDRTELWRVYDDANFNNCTWNPVDLFTPERTLSVSL